MENNDSHKISIEPFSLMVHATKINLIFCGFKKMNTLVRVSCQSNFSQFYSAKVENNDSHKISIEPFSLMVYATKIKLIFSGFKK